MKVGAIVAAFAVVLSLALLADAQGSTYLIGAGVYDITGPAYGGTPRVILFPLSHSSGCKDSVLCDKK